MEQLDGFYSPPIGSGVQPPPASIADDLRVRRVERERDELAVEVGELHEQLAAHRDAERSLMLAVLEADALMQRWAVVSQRIKSTMADQRLP